MLTSNILVRSSRTKIQRSQLDKGTSPQIQQEHLLHFRKLPGGKRRESCQKKSAFLNILRKTNYCVKSHFYWRFLESNLKDYILRRVKQVCPFILLGLSFPEIVHFQGE